MRKILLAVMALAVSGVSFAHCPNNIEKIYNRIQSHGVKNINVSYSADEEAWGNMIKNGLEAKGINVNATQVEGTKVCSITKGD